MSTPLEFVGEYSHVAMVERAVHNAKPRQPGKHPRWVAVMDVLAYGSTVSTQICEHFGLDPHEELDGPAWPAEPQMKQCPSCHGRGEWETECCNGAGGCDCRGQVVPMGTCNVCCGTGEVPEDVTQDQLHANVRAIAGRCFIGNGPTSGPWANRR